jgi:putative NIF3 family GTP cyclohydrolase 1 type 2
VDRLSGLDLVRVRLLTKNYISTYVIGSGWLCARDGLNDALGDALGVERIGDFLAESDYGRYVPFGRVCKPLSVKNHSGFVNYLASKLKLNTVLFSGDLDDDVGDFLLVAGSHIDMPHIITAKRQDLNTLVTGELTPEIRLLANEEGINTIELGAFVTEDPGMKRLRDSISLEYPDLKVEFMASTPIAQGLRPYKDDMA